MIEFLGKSAESREYDEDIHFEFNSIPRTMYACLGVTIPYGDASSTCTLPNHHITQPTSCYMSEEPSMHSSLIRDPVLVHGMCRLGAHAV